MSTSQVQVERRAAQRFDYHLPVAIRVAPGSCEACGFTQNLSARGALIYSEFPLAMAEKSEGNDVELTLVMPAEITLAEPMRVCCRGKILRVLSSGVENKSLVAVSLERYEFLPQTEDASGAFARISALHPHRAA